MSTISAKLPMGNYEPFNSFSAKGTTKALGGALGSSARANRVLAAESKAASKSAYVVDETSDAFKLLSEARQRELKELPVGMSDEEMLTSLFGAKVER